MSDILAILKIYRQSAWWVILNCGHWYKWTGERPPKWTGNSEDFPCPTCKPLPTVQRT